MKRQISLAQYRGIDLTILSVVLVISQVLIHFAASSWFADQLYVVSTVASVVALVMMRWGAWSAVQMVLGGVVYTLLSGGTAQHYLIYGGGNLLALGALVGTVTAAQTLIVTTTPQKYLTISLGAASAGMFAGLMGGQFLGGEMVSRFGFFHTFIWCGVLLGISTVLILFTKEDFHPVIRKKSSRSGVFRFRMPKFGRAGLLLLLFVLMGFSRDIDGPFLPQLVMEVAKNSSDALRWTGWINGLCALGGMLSGLILGYAASKIPLIKVLTCVIAIAGFMRILLTFAPNTELILCERFLQVLAAGGMEPLFQAWLAGVTRPQNHSKMLGWSATARSTGWMTGSMAGGSMAYIFGGVQGLFLVSGILYFLMLPAMYKVAKKVPPPGLIVKKKRA